MSPQNPRTRRLGVRRSVFLTQLVMAVCVLALVVLLFILNIGIFSQATFFNGVVLVFALTAIAATVDWSRLPSWTIAAVPIIDIIAVTLMRIEQPSIAVAFFYVFPVIWLASYFGRWGAIVGPALSSVLYVGLFAAELTDVDSDDLPRTLVVPISLAFVATVTFQTRWRSRAQRVILDRQSGLLQAALERSKRGEKLLDEALNAVNFGVLRMDTAGHIVFTNDAHRGWMHLHGQPLGPVEDLPFYDRTGRELLAEHEHPARRAANGEVFDGAVVWLGEPGSESRAALSIASRRLDDEHGLHGTVLTTRDITAELRAVKERDDLMASVTHELKNPLTSVTGFVELALDAPELSETTRRQLEVVLKSSDRMLALVTDLLEASRAEAVGLTLTMAPMDLAEVACDAVESARAGAGDIDLVCDVPQEAGMVGDAFRLRQVIDNLVSNAIKYNRPGGSVTVAIAEDGDCLELTVSDTGRGLTADEVDGLFGRYYRAASAQGVKGTGLGLNISREIVRRHNGDITVASEPDVGSTFTVRVPRASADEEERR